MPLLASGSRLQCIVSAIPGQEIIASNAKHPNILSKSSRRHVVIRRAVLSHHRANGSVHGGSLNLHVPFHTELRKIDNPYGLVARF